MHGLHLKHLFIHKGGLEPSTIFFCFRASSSLLFGNPNTTGLEGKTVAKNKRSSIAAVNHFEQLNLGEAIRNGGGWVLGTEKWDARGD